MATSKLQLLHGTGLKFNGEAGADVAFSMEAIATTAGRVSAQYDRGAGVLDTHFAWHCEFLMQATPTQYTSIDFYAAPAYRGDSTMIWGDVGASDAALGDVDMLNNLLAIGSVVVEEADTTKMVSGGWFPYPFRYISLVGHNNATGATINATDSNFLFFLSPYSVQGQGT